jgi:hypothetical protein
MPIRIAGCVVAAALALMPVAYGQRETFAAQVARIPGLGSGPGAAMDPEDEIDTGEIWVSDLNANTRTRIAGPGFRSPVFTPAGDAVLAIRDETIVRIPAAGGNAEDIFQLDSITKLAGVAPDGRVLVTADDNSMVGFLSLDDHKLRWLQPDESSADDKSALDRIRGWERLYGATKLAAARQTAGGKHWTDVVLAETGKEPVNVSQGEGVSCGEPAFAPAKRLVVFVRAQP